MRKETDFLGEAMLPDDSLYGINAWRAAQNFPDRTPFHVEWYRALGLVKLACYQTIRAFGESASSASLEDRLPAGMEDLNVFTFLEEAAEEISAGKHFDHFIVPAVQGGAGTSINMNINEIASNVALVKQGYKPGDYTHTDPFMHANLFQSTNDVVPSALKIAVMQLLSGLEDAINALRVSVEKLETNHRHELRMAYTQMQQALPSSYGHLFGSYNEALSRDWWRVSKSFERIKSVSLGGGATGSGMAIPRFFIMEVVSRLQNLTSLPVARSENLPDTTQNLDTFVEVHGILKAHAVNLEKIAGDLRLLSADTMGAGRIQIPRRQTGSSIMPGKVNPVIPEYIISTAHKVYSNDTLITSLCGQTSLDLNAYLPMIGHAIIDSLKLLVNAVTSMQKNLIEGLQTEKDDSLQQIMYSPSVTTALIPYIGYRKAGDMARHMKEHQCSIKEANHALQVLSPDKLEQLLKPEKLLQLGYSLRDLD